MDAFLEACEGRRTCTTHIAAERRRDRASGNPRRSESDFVLSLTTLCHWLIAQIALQTEFSRRPIYFAYSFRWLTSWACKRHGRTSVPLCQGDGIVSHRVLRNKTPLGLPVCGAELLVNLELPINDPESDDSRSHFSLHNALPSSSRQTAY